MLEAIGEYLKTISTCSIHYYKPMIIDWREVLLLDTRPALADYWWKDLTHEEYRWLFTITNGILIADHGPRITPRNLPLGMIAHESVAFELNEPDSIDLLDSFIKRLLT